MKTDDFETSFRKPPFRSIPPEWRGEILQAAQTAAEVPTPEPRQVWWRELLWPCPKAWAAVAAAWVVILGSLWIGGEKSESSGMVASAPQPNAPTILALSFQYRFNLIDPPPPAIIEPPKPSSMRPRSERAQNIAVA